jgi:hypothetical protein
VLRGPGAADVSVWRCKRCREWGIGGPAGFVKHEKSAHVYDVRLGASMSFGFTGNYASGNRTDRFGTHWTRPVRMEGMPE